MPNIQNNIFYHFFNRVTRDFEFTNQKKLGTNLFSYLDYDRNVSYPVKGHPPGKGLYIGFNRERSDFEIGSHEIYEFVVPHRDYNGIELYFHDPYEVISEQTTVRHVKETAVTKFSVNPKILIADTSIADVYVQEYVNLKFLSFIGCSDNFFYF